MIFDLSEELDKQFPKGDKSRGKALVLHSLAQIRIKQLERDRLRLFKQSKEVSDKLIESREENERIVKEIKEWLIGITFLKHFTNTNVIEEFDKKFPTKEQAK